VGIDVSAKTLDVAYRDVKGRIERQTFENETAAHAALVRHLKKRAGGKKVRVVLESTGVYGLDLALALDRAEFEVMVANPRATSNFAKATMQRSKTDRLDCAMLLEFAEQMTFKQWQAPSKVTLQVRGISRRVHALMTTIRDEKNRMHAANQVDGTTIVKRSIRDTIKAAGDAGAKAPCHRPEADHVRARVEAALRAAVDCKRDRTEECDFHPGRTRCVAPGHDRPAVGCTCRTGSSAV